MNKGINILALSKRFLVITMRKLCGEKFDQFKVSNHAFGHGDATLVCDHRFYDTIQENEDVRIVFKATVVEDQEVYDL